MWQHWSISAFKKNVPWKHSSNVFQTPFWRWLRHTVFIRGAGPDLETWAGSPLLNYILQIPCKQAGEEIERGEDKSKNGSKWISENLLRNINTVMDTCGVMKSKDLQVKSVSNLNIYKTLGCPPEHLYKEPNGTMTWIITKQRGCLSGKTGFPMTSLEEAQVIQIFFFQSKSIYMDLQTAICIGIVPSIHTNTIQLSWNRTSLFVLSWCFDNITTCKWIWI